MKHCTIISSQDLTYNGRYKKCRATIEGLGFSTRALQLCASKLEEPSSFDEAVHIIEPSYFGPNPVLRPLSYRLQKARVSRWLKPQFPSIFHAIDYVALDVAVKAKQKWGGTVVFDACEIFGETSHVDIPTKAYIRRILSRSFPYVDAVITPSKYLCDYYKSHYPELPDPVIVNNAPILSNRVVDTGKLRAALNVKPKETVLLFHGALIADRGIEKIIRTAGELSDKVTLCVLGYGALRDLCLSEAERVNIKAGRKVVHVLPPVPNEELLGWIAGADFGLIPYQDTSMNHRYCTPNKLYEYAAAGLPILATGLPSLTEIIEGNDIGFIIRPSVTVDKINETLSAFDDTSRSAMKDRCMAFTESHSGLSSQIALSNLYQSLH